jgi:hypothetical protein
MTILRHLHSRKQVVEFVHLTISLILFSNLSVTFHFPGLTLTSDDVVFDYDQKQPKCAKCNFYLPSRGYRYMESHVNRVHKKISPYVCQICRLAFASQLAMEIHHRWHRNNQAASQPSVIQHHANLEPASGVDGDNTIRCNSNPQLGQYHRL